MKSSRFVRNFSALVVAGGACASFGCNPGAALWLQDYGRDLLLSGGALAAALAALGQANDALDTANNANDTAQAALDLADASQGQPGAPGPQGPPGPAGQDGAAGQNGADGAQGAAGAAGQNGQNGANGADGAPGPAFFSQFVSQFFRPPTNLQGDGAPGGESDDAPTFGAAVGWRMILSNRYHAGNPVTMRLYIDADYSLDPGRPTECEQFRIAFVRMRNGAPVETYGTEKFVLINVPENAGQVFMVIDLPLNVPVGMNLPNDLQAGQLLGVGMEWSDPVCTTLGRDYRIFGVEFFESASDAVTTVDATITDTPQDCSCGGNGGE
jgi:hypothetical protein